MKEPSYGEILKHKIEYYGETQAAYELAAEEFAKQMIKFNDNIKQALPQLKHIYIVYFLDIDTDTLFISQMKPIGYFELEGYAKEFADFINQTDEEPNRIYKYTKI